MQPAWNDFPGVRVTLDRSDSRSLLSDEHVVRAHGPTFRDLKNLVRNLWLTWLVIGAVKPEVILTTGAAAAVPCAWLGRLRVKRIVDVESFTRVNKPSFRGEPRLAADLRAYIASCCLVCHQGTANAA